MKRKLFFTISLLLGCVAILNAQTYLKTDDGIKSIIDSVVIELKFYNPSVVRVVKYPEKTYFNKKSLSVVAAPTNINLKINQKGKELIIRSEKIQLVLNLIHGNITFSTIQGASLLREQEKGSTFMDFNDSGVETYSVKQEFRLSDDEAIYGLGQQQQGKMVQRNITLNMVQGNTDDYVPFFLSNKGYGVFWDNYSPTIFKDDIASTSFKSIVGDGIDYYFMYGGNADNVIAAMRNLTGQVPMFPLWTYGYWQSKERYKSQNELIGVVKKFRDLGVPLDGIVQDWQYWGNNYLWNAMDFLNPEFYNPQKMIDDIHDLNAHMIISIWSSFGPQTLQYKDLKHMDALLDFATWPESGTSGWPPNPDYPSGVKVYDAYNPKARDIYWHYLNKGLFSLGIDGWWMDSTEPDVFESDASDQITHLGSFRKVRNAYPLMTVGGVYKHQRSVDSAKRAFILTRSVFAGQQRYGNVIWSGDVQASWEALRHQISAGLNLSLTGVPYWTSDIGGFFLSNYENPLQNTDYRELYARWVQFGTFCPMMRSHGTDAPREIYQFGKKGNPIYDAIEKAINLRYLLLPYIYSTSWEVTTHQSTMMRALIMDFAEDKKVLDINDEYMFGKSLLVSPVTRPMYSKEENNEGNTTVADFSQVETKGVYLPRGTRWFDFWTGEKYNGGQEVVKKAPIDIIPLFVKEGSILPIGPKVQYATEKSWDSLEIRIYPGKDGEFVLYEDENDNYNYEKGKFSTINLTWDNAKQTLTIHRRNGSFPGMLTDRRFRIVKVSENNGQGMNSIEEYDKVVFYDGSETKIKL